MKIKLSDDSEIAREAVERVKQSRIYGSTYKPVDMPNRLEFEDGSYIYFGSYGRSLSGRGHKYKGYCNDANGKPIKTSQLCYQKTKKLKG